MAYEQHMLKQEEEQSWLGKANDGPRSPYPSSLANPAPSSHQPNPLRASVPLLPCLSQYAELYTMPGNRRFTGNMITIADIRI